VRGIYAWPAVQKLKVPGGEIYMYIYIWRDKNVFSSSGTLKHQGGVIDCPFD
jgi:hypothetical protein